MSHLLLSPPLFRYLSSLSPLSLHEMTLQRRVSIWADPPGPPEALTLSLRHQLNAPLTFRLVLAVPFFPHSPVITLYPRELDPLTFVSVAWQYILSRLSSHFLCLSEALREHY